MTIPERLHDQSDSDLSWSPEKDLLTETEEVDGATYPTWIVERARQLRGRIPGRDLASAIRVVLANVEAERNSVLTNPNELSRVVIHSLLK